MTQRTYDYLKPFLCKLFEVPTENNYFYPVSEEQIIKAEARMGFAFPSQLREFYQEIGCGSLCVSPKDVEDYSSMCRNKILPPWDLAEVMNGVLINEEEGLYFSEDAYDDLAPGDLPFFDVLDACKFLIMKINSENPNAVYTVSNIKIEDSFERFMWRLYHEKSDFYDDIIQDHYKALKL